MFFIVRFQRERSEALQAVTFVGHVLGSMVKSPADNRMESEFRGLVMVVRVLVAMRSWLW
jgi:hypothetical protein